MGKDALDQLIADVANASSPFQLASKWPDIQTGFAALGKWKEAVEQRLAAVEDLAHQK